MKKLPLILAIFSALLTASCNDPDQASVKNELINCWEYSIADSEGAPGNVFVPCHLMHPSNSEFQPRFELFENNDASYFLMSPIDAHEMYPGTWTYDEESKILTISLTINNIVISYNVVSIESEELIITPR